ncbi:MAG: helix-turn-helix transcriptional regulator [Thermoleophilia bacterium]
MARDEYRPVPHDHDAFLERALSRRGFREAYDENEDEYLLLRELLAARAQAGLTQEEVAASMGTTKSAVSRLEGGGRHSPSVKTLKRYAKAVGCEVEIRLVAASRRTGASNRLGERGTSLQSKGKAAPRR